MEVVVDFEVDMDFQRCVCSGSRELCISHSRICNGSTHIPNAVRQWVSPYLVRQPWVMLGVVAPIAVTLELYDMEETFLRSFWVGMGDAEAYNTKGPIPALENVKESLPQSQGVW